MIYLFIFLVGTTDVFYDVNLQFSSNPYFPQFQISNVENLSPQIIRQVVKELQDLVMEPPEGIKVQMNDEDVTDIQAYIEGPGNEETKIKRGVQR